MTACATFGNFRHKQYSVISDCGNAEACERSIIPCSLRSEPKATAEADILKVNSFIIIKTNIRNNEHFTGTILDKE